MTLEILKEHNPTIRAVDFSPGMVEMVQQATSTLPNVTTGVMNAQNLEFPDATFTHSYMNFVLFALPDPQLGVDEIYRTLKPGGAAGISLHKNYGWLDPVHRMQKAVHPESPLMTVPMDAVWNEKQHAANFMEKSGFRDVNVSEFTGRASVDGLFPMFKTAMFSRIFDGWSDTEKASFEDTFRSVCSQDELDNGIVFQAYITTAVKPDVI